jgi:hypothetical protein
MTSSRLGLLAFASGTALALVPAVGFGMPEDGGEAVFTVLLFVFSVAPFVLFAAVQPGWNRAGALATLAVMCGIDVFFVVSILESEDSTAGIAFLVLPFVLTAVVAVAAVVLRLFGGRREVP